MTCRKKWSENKKENEAKKKKKKPEREKRDTETGSNSKWKCEEGKVNISPNLRLLNYFLTYR